MASTLLYDFKRSLLKPVALITLAFFVIAGIGVGLYLHHISGIGPSDYENLNLLALCYHSVKNSFITGIVFNNQGEPLPDAKVLVMHDGEVVNSTVTNNQGTFNIDIGYPLPLNTSESTPNIVVEVEYNGLTRFWSSVPQYSGTGYGALSSGVNYGVIPIISSSELWKLNVNLPLIFSKSSESGIAILQEFGDNLIILSPDNLTLELGFFHNISQFNVNSPLPIKKVVNVSAFKPEIVSLNIPNGTNYVVVEYYLPGSPTSIDTYISAVYPHTDLWYNVLYNYPNPLVFYSLLFPFIAIYLAYSMFADPRSNGTLEFLLARPVTKGILYFNRFMANLLTVLVSSIIFNAVAALVILLITGILIPSYTIIMETLGTFSNLSAYVSLTYMSGGLTRQSKLALAIPISLYLVLLAIVFSASSFPSMPWLVYVPPLVLENYINDQILITLQPQILTPVQPLSLLGSVVSAALWVTVPAIIGYVAFKKEDI
ncbi:ABC transporter permease subunit [Stygiolobus sp. CP859M]|uniref:ABC transporter permease subunit n=1 Tax=Stygiolobus sp. CP859M TaxID=3133135 RepID=UPI00307FBD54